MTMLAVFRSRAHTLAFLSSLREAGIPASAVNTPKEAGVGCGISARFDGRFLPRVRAVLQRRPYASFAGFMQSGGMGFFYFNA